VRFARILALLLALATFAVTGYLFWQMPFAWLHMVPANLGVLASLYFWRKAPRKKTARRTAALASIGVIPCMVLSAAVSLFESPITDWPVFLALAALATLVAVTALLRVNRKQSHVWAGYYQDVT